VPALTIKIEKNREIIKKPKSRKSCFLINFIMSKQIKSFFYLRKTKINCMNIYILIPYQKGEENAVLNNLRALSRPIKSARIKVYVVGPKKLKGKAKCIVEKKRRGKSHWIEKILLKRKKGLLVLISGDVEIKKNFISEALKKMKEGVGMLCCSVLPHKPKSFVEKLAYLVWVMYEEASKLQPKGGEAIVFRAGIVKKFHKKVVTDEAYIEANIARSGWKIVYDSKLLVRNKLPKHISEYFSQRVRYHIGHLQVKKETGYCVVSLKYLLLLKAAVRVIKKKPEFALYLIFVSLIEIIARIWGKILFSVGRLPYRWRIAWSTRI